MNIADILQNIEFVKKVLSNYIQTNLISSSVDEISWRNYRPGVFNNHYYPLEYQWLLDNGQYSILLRNGAFFQFYYKFDGKGLRYAKLALYPRPIPSFAKSDDITALAEKSFDMDDLSLSEYLMNVVEEIDQTNIVPPNTSHVRFDFDREVNSHEISQLQFGGVNEVRIPANFFPIPYSFVELMASALDGVDIHPHLPAGSHSINKVLRKLECDRLISLAHS